MNAQSHGSSTAKRGRIEIDPKAIAHNVGVIRKLIPASTRLMAVVKANGYGMGGVEVARAAKGAGADFLGVGTLAEAAALEEAGIAGPFFLMEPCLAEDIPEIVGRGIVQAVTHPKLAELLSAEAQRQGKTVDVHLNVNVGMNRLGFSPGEAVENIGRLTALPGLRWTGILAQFPSAGEKDKAVTRSQFKDFQALVERLQKSGASFPLRHVGNSAVILDLPEFALDLVRAGILLYGVPPSGEVRFDPVFREAVSVKSSVVHVFRAEKGETVSYGRTWIVPRAGTLATLPVGTADGISGELSNKGMVLIRGKRFPIAGRICMDLMVVFLGDDTAELGEEAVLLGKQGAGEITVRDWIQWGNLDPHEILTGLGGKLPKIYL